MDKIKHYYYKTLNKFLGKPLPLGEVISNHKSYVPNHKFGGDINILHYNQEFVKPFRDIWNTSFNLINLRVGVPIEIMFKTRQPSYLGTYLSKFNIQIFLKETIKRTTILKTDFYEEN